MVQGAVTGLTEWDIIIRLVVITIITGLIGMEREYAGKPAGLRTIIMVGLGSTIFTLASIRSVDIFGAAASPTRIASNIVTGIGFLGVGTIMVNREKERVIGLTTAATMWVTAGLGIAVGMGLYLEAIVTTVLVFLTFYMLSPVVDMIRGRGKRTGSDQVEQ